MVALLLAGVVAAVVARSRHATGGADARLVAHAATRRQLRAAAAALPSTLRALAPADVRAMDDTALDVRATIGGGVLCGIDTVAAVATLAAAGLPGTGWTSPPHEGDTLLVLAPLASAPPADDARAWGWRPLHVTGDAAPAVAPCLAHPALATMRVPIDLPPSGPDVAGDPAPGAAARLTRRARWSAYRAGDGRWYLGYREARGAGLAGVQPVSGPHDVPGPSASRRPGVRFTFHDGAGGSATDADSLARVDVLLRAAVSARATGPSVTVDSLALSVALRHGP